MVIMTMKRESHGFIMLFCCSFYLFPIQCYPIRPIKNIYIEPRDSRLVLMYFDVLELIFITINSPPEIYVDYNFCKLNVTSIELWFILIYIHFIWLVIIVACCPIHFNSTQFHKKLNIKKTQTQFKSTALCVSWLLLNSPTVWCALMWKNCGNWSEISHWKWRRMMGLRIW